MELKVVCRAVKFEEIVGRLGSISSIDSLKSAENERRRNLDYVELILGPFVDGVDVKFQTIRLYFKWILPKLDRH